MTRIIRMMARGCGRDGRLWVFITATGLLAATQAAPAALLNTYTSGRTDGSQIYFDGTSNIVATQSAFSFADSAATRVVNGSGFFTNNGANVNPLLVPPNFIDKDLDTVFPDQDAGGSNTQWLLNGAAAGGINMQWVAFDLGQVVSLNEIKVWNSSQNGQTARGIATAFLWVSTAASPSITATSGGASPGPDWVKIGINPFNLLIATPISGVDDNITDINFSRRNVRHVMLDVETSHGSTDFIGLGEMQFFGIVPEPASAALMMALGVSTVLRRRR